MSDVNQDTRDRRDGDGSRDAGRRRRESQLSEEEIVEAALALTKRVGLENLTMRALAQELGVSAMAAYYYVPNKEALISLVANAVLAKVKMPGPDAGSWEERLWTFIDDTRRELAAHPGVADFLMQHELTSEGRRHMEESIGVLLDAGYPVHTARRMYSSIYAYSYGRVALASLVTSRAMGRRDTRRGRGRRSALPSLAELASDEHAELGYRALVTGLRQIVGEPERSGDDRTTS